MPQVTSKGASRESREEDTATIELIRCASALALELYPSPARSKTDDEIAASCSAADCTHSLQAAIDSGAGTVHVPYIGRPLGCGAAERNRVCDTTAKQV